ncbi:MAG: cyclopropane fatty acyl phospholipid synthase [Bacteroidota bacterium]
MTLPGNMTGIKNDLRELLLSADIVIDGDRPWDIQVHNEGFYTRVVRELTIGLGESYMDGWWDCQNLDQFFYHILSSHLDEKVKRNSSIILSHLLGRIFNIQSRVRLKKGIAATYDKGIDLYMSFLDPYNQYTCGYFDKTDDLAKAQELKLDLICRKLGISAQDHVLDIGCGWGGFAKFLAERIGCKVTGISISQQQLEYARKFCSGYDVEFLEMDYRDLTKRSFGERFDKIVVVGMIEHIGYKNYRQLMRAVSHCLKKEGLFLLHTIGSNVSTTSTETNLWLTKYIFPHGMTPSMKQISAASENLFIIEDVQNFGMYYDPTLMAWANNFEKNWNTIKSHYDERFHRMWRYYLLSCAGAMRARHDQLWQVVFTKKGAAKMYVSVR